MYRFLCTTVSLQLHLGIGRHRGIEQKNSLRIAEHVSTAAAIWDVNPPPFYGSRPKALGSIQKVSPSRTKSEFHLEFCGSKSQSEEIQAFLGFQFMTVFRRPLVRIQKVCHFCRCGDLVMTSPLLIHTTLLILFSRAFPFRGFLRIVIRRSLRRFLLRAMRRKLRGNRELSRRLRRSFRNCIFARVMHHRVAAVRRLPPTGLATMARTMMPSRVR
jgi:hypothetical protein